MRHDLLITLRSHDLIAAQRFGLIQQIICPNNGSLSLF